ncbi:unnamed protein product [Paramecium octaurelia]|uniref:Uncharacterized protein n=1 Tax=Paramecium octaurelia TaxID=43137 RepID=A0A8S1VDT8_PAROT|nr:unnamed protein product [Paramecium octaurelia]
MSDFSQPVIKNQKIKSSKIVFRNRAEDDKMMKAILMQNQIEQNDEDQERRQPKQQQQEMRQYLIKQMDDKKKTQNHYLRQKVKEEEELNKKQAQVCSYDLQMYQTHEKQKFNYIKEASRYFKIINRRKKIIVATQKQNEQ